MGWKNCIKLFEKIATNNFQVEDQDQEKILKEIKVYENRGSH